MDRGEREELDLADLPLVNVGDRYRVMRPGDRKPERCERCGRDIELLTRDELHHLIPWEPPPREAFVWVDIALVCAFDDTDTLIRRAYLVERVHTLDACNAHRDEIAAARSELMP